MISLLYDLVYGIPLCLLALVGGYSIRGTESPGIGAGVLAVVSLLFFICLRHLSGKIRIMLMGLPTALGVGLLLVKRPDRQPQFWVDNAWMAGIVLMAVLVYAFVRAMNRCFPVKVVGAVALFGMLLILLTNRMNRMIPEKWVTVLSFFLIVCVMVELVHRNWKRTGYTEVTVHLVYLLPFLLLWSVLIYLIPAPEQPYNWKLVKQIWERAEEGVHQLTQKWFHGEDEDYEDVVIGFSDRGGLAGELSGDADEVMKLTCGWDPGPKVYLVGKVFDTFDGKEWSCQNVSEDRDRILDTLETLAAVKQYDSIHALDYIKPVDLTVEYSDFTTKYMFTPAKSVLLPMEEEAAFRDEELLYRGGDILFPTQQGYRTRYEIQSYRLNNNAEMFSRLLREHDIVIERESWEKTLAEFDLSGQNAYSYERLQSHQQLIEEYYHRVGPLSENSKAYLEKVLEGYEDPLERLCRIEEMLQSFTYTENPGKLSSTIQRDVDFLDDFLLDKREGYCSYFATAFVLLARVEGFPARFVQGFCVPAGASGTYPVTSDLAHAWPEVYFEGLGWIPFEPTPGYRTNTSWMTSEERQLQRGGNYPDFSAEEEAEDEFEVPEELQNKAEKGQKLYMILIPVGMVFLFLVLFVTVNRMLMRYRYKRLSLPDQFKVVCKRNLKILTKMGFPLTGEKTLEELAREAGQSLEMENLSFLPLYENFLYGKEKIDHSDLQVALVCNESLLAELKKRSGKIRYFLALLEN